MPNFSYSSVCPVDDYIVELVVELETAAQLRDSQFIFPQRPWLDLYGINVRPVAPFGSASSKQFLDPALIHQVLPDELLFEILSKMTPYTLGRSTCVCRKWRYTIRNPVSWHNACLKTWQVCYYRYMRFYPSGRFLYKNSSQKVKDVAKYLNFRASKASCVFKGSYPLSEDKVEDALLYPGTCPTVLRFRLRSTNLMNNGPRSTQYIGGNNSVFELLLYIFEYIMKFIASTVV